MLVGTAPLPDWSYLALSRFLLVEARALVMIVGPPFRVKETIGPVVLPEVSGFGCFTIISAHDPSASLGFQD
jgi:hypothetical protein